MTIPRRRAPQRHRQLLGKPCISLLRVSHSNHTCSEARAAKTHTVAFQQTRQYVPPKDFQSFSVHNATSSSTNMFKDLKGKQIWHITAPEDVSLKSLEQLAMDKVNEGGAILKHKGASYGLSTADSAGEGRKVLLPATNGFKAGESGLHALGAPFLTT